MQILRRGVLDKIRREVHLRGFAATVDILRLQGSSLGLPSVARPKGERRMVDQTGIEPVTS